MKFRMRINRRFILMWRSVPALALGLSALAAFSAPGTAVSSNTVIPEIAGLAVQVNEGGPVPSASLLSSFLPPGQTVRDALGWHRVENAKGQYAMPAANWELYATVASVHGKNVVTLFGGNKLYGMEKNSDFPTTAEQIEGFANFAAWVARNDGAAKPNEHAANIPNLYAVTVWNEMNGTWNGGISEPKARQDAMASLLNAIVPKIRIANSSVRIAAGAFTGFPGLANWFQGIGRHFDWRSVDWLDIHPYLADLREKPAEEWARQMILLRSGDLAHGIPPIKNPAYYSEWGGPAAVKYARAHANDPTAITYFEWFHKNIVEADPVPVAGGNYFTLFCSPQFPLQGLATGPTGQVTPLGASFRGMYVH